MEFCLLEERCHFHFMSKQTNKKIKKNIQKNDVYIEQDNSLLGKQILLIQFLYLLQDINLLLFTLASDTLYLYRSLFLSSTSLSLSLFISH